MQYETPSVVDYGTLRDLTALDLSGLPFGIAGASSTPTGPGPEGGPPAGPATAGGTPETPGMTPDNGLPGGEQSSGGDDVGVGGGGATGGGVAGAQAGGGASAGGTDESLPFTGFAAAMVGALGAGLAATGAAVRRALRRRDSEL